MIHFVPIELEELERILNCPKSFFLIKRKKFLGRPNIFSSHENNYNKELDYNLINYETKEVILINRPRVSIDERSHRCVCATFLFLFTKIFIKIRSLLIRICSGTSARGQFKSCCCFTSEYQYR